VKLPLKCVFALSLLIIGPGGCVVVPLDSEGRPMYYYPNYPASDRSSRADLPSGAPRPVSIPVRLYPDNDVATQTGVVTGVVTNMMNGKGRFNLNYRGDTLTGEATRVSGDERRGIASAYSPSGAYMSCEYQMNTPRQGAGTCTFSNGARYKLHVGS